MIKTFAPGFFVLVSLALGGMLVHDQRQIAGQSAQITELQAQVVRQHDEISKTRSAAAEMEQKHSQLLARAKATRQSLADARNAAAAVPAVAATPAPADAATGGKKKPANPFTDSIANMMKDPAMKNMMRTTQATSIRQMYGDLVKQWSLSPEEADTFYNLLLDKQMDQMDQGMKFMEKGPDAVDAANTANAGDPDAQLKASLGDDLYKQYRAYEKTLSERLTVNQLQQQLAVSNVPAMTADQSQVLMQAITEEQASMPKGSLTQPMSPKGDPFNIDPAQVDTFMKAQGDLDDKIDTRMANTLSAEQLQVLKQQQQQALSVQRMGLEMAAKMMAPAATP